MLCFVIETLVTYLITSTPPPMLICVMKSNLFLAMQAAPPCLVAPKHRPITCKFCREYDTESSNKNIVRRKIMGTVLRPPYYPFENPGIASYPSKLRQLLLRPLLRLVPCSNRLWFSRSGP